MTSYDWLLIMLGAGLVVFFTFQRMARTLFMLAVVWLATLVAALAYREATFRLSALTAGNPVAARGWVFLILFVLLLIAGYIAFRVAFPVTKLPKLGVLDYVMGALLGMVIAVVIVTMILNGIGIMVTERWEDNPEGWARLRSQYYNSGLLPYTRPVLAGYAWLFWPFFRTDFPPVLVPQ